MIFPEIFPLCAIIFKVFLKVSISLLHKPKIFHKISLVTFHVLEASLCTFYSIAASNFLVHYYLSKVIRTKLLQTSSWIFKNILIVCSPGLKQHYSQPEIVIVLIMNSNNSWGTQQSEVCVERWCCVWCWARVNCVTTVCTYEMVCRWSTSPSPLGHDVTSII